MALTKFRGSGWQALCPAEDGTWDQKGEDCLKVSLERGWAPDLRLDPSQLQGCNFSPRPLPSTARTLAQRAVRTADLRHWWQWGLDRGGQVFENYAVWSLGLNCSSPFLKSVSPWSSPGQNAGVGSLSLLQGIFPTQGSNRGLLHCRWILYQLSYQGSPIKWPTIFWK